MATQLQKIIQALRGTPAPTMPNIPPNQMQGIPQPTPSPQMGGMAGQAQQNLQTFIPAYKQYQMQTMESGQQPIPFEAFVQQMQGQR